MGAKGARTRQRLIDATSHLLRSRPLLELSVADITKQAETATATFYLYFQDVSEAVLAVIGQVSQSTPDLLNLLAADWDGPGRVHTAMAFANSYFDHWEANASLFRARNVASDEGDERFIEARAVSVHSILNQMADRIAVVQARGRLPSDLHPASAAAGFLAMIERTAAVSNTRTATGNARAGLIGAAAFFLSVLMGGLSEGALGD